MTIRFIGQNIMLEWIEVEIIAFLCSDSLNLSMIRHYTESTETDIFD
jgi:hypothetical protein